MELSQDFFDQFGQNAGFIREQFELYAQDRTRVPPSWASFFDSYLGIVTSGVNGSTSNGHHYAPSTPNSDLEERVYRLVRTYRERGHLKAKINPLSHGVMALPVSRDLQVEAYGFSTEELNLETRCDRFQGHNSYRLSELLAALDRFY